MTDAADESAGAEELFEVEVSAGEGRATLHVRAERLKRDHLPEFQAACDRLLESKQPELLIEARELHMMGSVFIGAVITTSEHAREAGQHMVMTAGESMAEVLRRLLGESVEVRAG